MSGRTSDGTTRVPFLTKHVSIAILAVVYLSFALTFSLLTRAYEADDEQAHTQYIEYILRHDALPHISAANLQESHQPPLYYLLTAAWQKLLAIPVFTPVVVQEHYKNPFIHDRLMLSHNYTATQHQDAVYLHELRLLSVLLGLGTVLLSYAAAKVAWMRESVALSVGLFVALLPRELVVSSSVTNDALVIPLCALALVMFLFSERARASARQRHRRLYVLGMGAALGAAAATKFNSLPVAAVLFVLALTPSVRLPVRPSNQLLAREAGPTGSLIPSGDPSSGRSAWSASDQAESTDPIGVGWGLRVDGRAVVDGLIGLIAFFAASGWWFVRNKHLYGQFLATRASEAYLRAYFLHPLPWSTHLVFEIFPQTFFVSTWYSQPNILLPTWMNQALAVAGLLCLAAGAWALLAAYKWVSPRLPRLSGLALIGCVAAGIVAVLITIKSTSIGDARTAFVGLSAFAVVVVVGTTWLSSRINLRLELIGLLLWPTAFVAVDLYVLLHVLIPLGGL